MVHLQTKAHLSLSIFFNDISLLAVAKLYLIAEY